MLNFFRVFVLKTFFLNFQFCFYFVCAFIAKKSSKQSQLDVPSVSSSSITMPSTVVVAQRIMTNGYGKSASPTPPSPGVVPSTLHPDSNISTNLSSNSSIYSSSIKSNKSNDETAPTAKPATEKKPKSFSSSRQKKFHRHFKQVPADEEVINCKYLFQNYLFAFLVLKYSLITKKIN